MPTSAYKEYMKACMLKKNTKGKSANEVRAALTDCARAWTRAIERRAPEPFDEQALAEQYAKRY